MATKTDLAAEQAKLNEDIAAMALKWRELAYQVQADMKGSMKGGRHFRPGGIVKEKMKTQVSVLLSCAVTLETLL